MNNELDNLNLENMDRADLIAFKNKVDAAIATFDARKRQEALAAAEKAVSELGFSLKELTNFGVSSKEKRLPAAPKYKHPENPDLTWTGKGRRPAWFIEAMETGKNPEDLAI